MEGQKGRTAVFLLLLACWLLVLSNGGIAQTWQKVVACPSAAGGSSAPTYLGVTSSSYDGLDVGGYVGANAKCVAQYGSGARMMTITDNRKMNRSTAYPADGWIDTRNNYSFHEDSGHSNVYIDDYGLTSQSSFLTVSCDNFTSRSSFYWSYGITIFGSVSYIVCASMAPIHCVRD